MISHGADQRTLPDPGPEAEQQDDPQDQEDERTHGQNHIQRPAVISCSVNGINRAGQRAGTLPPAGETENFAEYMPQRKDGSARKPATGAAIDTHCLPESPEGP